jgi:hypothetical protein
LLGFGKRDLPTLKETRQRQNTEDVPIGGVRRVRLLQRAIGFSLDQRKDTLRLSFDRRRAPVPPCGLGVTLPVSTQRIALDVLTQKCAAAARRDIPPSTAATTRMRRSSERDVAMTAGLDLPLRFSSR